MALKLPKDSVEIRTYVYFKCLMNEAIEKPLLEITAFNEIFKIALFEM